MKRDHNAGTKQQQQPSSPRTLSSDATAIIRCMGYGMALLFALCSFHVSRQMLIVLGDRDEGGSMAMSLTASAAASASSYKYLPDYGLRLRRTTTTSEASVYQRQNNNKKRIVKKTFSVTWLMSYPHSGATYTLQNIQHLTQQSTATIYETEVDDEHVSYVEASHLVQMSATARNAPQQERQSLSDDYASDVSSRLLPHENDAATDAPRFYLYNSSLPIPDNLLVKTHCTNFCENCVHVHEEEADFDEFERLCRTEQRKQPQRGQTPVTPPQYTVSSVIHLWRNPLDNILSRMHSHGSEGSFKKATRSKVLAWCSYSKSHAIGGTSSSNASTAINTKMIQKALSWLDDDDETSWSALAANVPCVFDLIRLVQWHNHALQVATRANVPVMHLYYEDYATNDESLRDTNRDLLSFLNLKGVASSSPLPFDASSERYARFFTQMELSSMAKLIKRLASRDTWPFIRNYVHELRLTETFEMKDRGIDKANEAKALTQLGPHQPEFTSDIVWLVSFPNSGTSYTMNNVRRTSNMTTATNYAAEAIQTAGRLVPVKPNLPDGPYLLLPNLQVPKYSLTKTHCTAYCDACQTMDTVRALDQFEEGCRIVTKGVWPNLTKISQRYEPVKAVHIFRSPFDNLVARKHLGSKRRLTLGIFKPDDLAFQDSREGMVAWCNFIDKGFITSAHNKGIQPFTPELEALFRKVPCYSDWFRYIQWHDLAMAAVGRMEIPVHDIYYESYSDNYDHTVRKLNQFLELPSVVEPEPFITGKQYRHFFNRDDVAHARELVKYLSTMQLWKKLRHYFDDDQFGFKENLSSGAVGIQQSANDHVASEEDNIAVGIIDEEQKEATINDAGDDDDGEELEGEDDDDVDDGTDDDASASGEGLLMPSTSPRTKIAWLMSFPNSGTSYTITNIQHMSNMTQATNHGMEANQSLPLLPDLPNGPFILDPQREVGKYTLVKTHCTGYCDVCNQTQSKKKLRAFQMGCVSTKRNENGVFVVHKYNETIPKKAVHVFRNPFDNMVARMHLGVKDRRMAGFPSSLLNTFNDTEAGILSWCSYMDAEFAKASNSSYFSAETLQLMPQVPCHSDLFRYIQWHNLAIQLVDKLQLPHLMVHYEDYATDYNTTMNSLLKFLDVEPVQAPLDFVLGKSYVHLYSKQHARSMALLARSMASPSCWEQVRRYFQEFFSVDDQNLLASKATAR
ncbi:hypothetical protein MPSEU_000932700 [Mayamaea pseudoterrestris]|nr:hypothetical protein MPSEU_000932700 [Mayamaea pseudoterrestris]